MLAKYDSYVRITLCCLAGCVNHFQIRTHGDPSYQKQRDTWTLPDQIIGFHAVISRRTRDSDLIAAIATLEKQILRKVSHRKHLIGMRDAASVRLAVEFQFGIQKKKGFF